MVDRILLGLKLSEWRLCNNCVFGIGYKLYPYLNQIIWSSSNLLFAVSNWSIKIFTLKLFNLKFVSLLLSFRIQLLILCNKFREVGKYTVSARDGHKFHHKSQLMTKWSASWFVKSRFRSFLCEPATNYELAHWYMLLWPLSYHNAEVKWGGPS